MGLCSLPGGQDGYQLVLCHLGVPDSGSQRLPSAGTLSLNFSHLLQAVSMSWRLPPGQPHLQAKTSTRQWTGGPAPLARPQATAGGGRRWSRATCPAAGSRLPAPAAGLVPGPGLALLQPASALPTLPLAPVPPERSWRCAPLEAPRACEASWYCSWGAPGCTSAHRTSSVAPT